MMNGKIVLKDLLEKLMEWQKPSIDKDRNRENNFPGLM